MAAATPPAPIPASSPSSSSSSSSTSSGRSFQQNQANSNVRRPGPGAYGFSPLQREKSVAALKAADPAFDEQAFYARVALAFQKIQAAWSVQDLSQVRAFVSDGVHERFGLQFAEQRADGYRNVMRDVQVTQVILACVVTEGGFDAATLRISASAVDLNVSLADGHRLANSEGHGSFVEYWTLLRRRGAATRAGNGLIEGNCPNCAAPIEMNAGAKCASCGALLRSGQYDWVVAEITQASVWQMEEPLQVPGVAQHRQRDPDFSLADLEDRASVIFWRKSMADQQGKIDPLRKVAADDFCQRYEPFLHPHDAQGRVFSGRCAVGSATTLGVIPAPGAMDRALVSIRWEGQRFLADSRGAVRPAGDRVQARSLFVLARKNGVKTDPGQSISSAHCPNCGGPATIDTANACEFCGTVLNDGSRSWVLTGIFSMTSTEAQQLVGRARAMSGASPFGG
jgi:hypothetical protein